MTLTDRRILLFPALVAVAAWISASIHSTLPILIAGEIGFIGMYFMRTPEQRKIVSNGVIAGIMGILLVCIALAFYSHK